MAVTSFYSEDELSGLGLKSYGNNVLISRFARLYRPQNIDIGNNVRIDDFCLLSAGSSIKIGNYVHIACYTSIIGEGEVVLSDFSGLSSHVCLYSSTDNYTGEFMTNPTVPSELTDVYSAPVFVGRHVVVGCSSVILPGVKIGDGCAIGAMSFVHKNCQPGFIYSGNPLKKLVPRLDNYLELEKNINI